MAPRIRTVQGFNHKAVKGLLERLDFSVLEFVKALGPEYRYQTILHILTGRRKPMPELVEKMAEVLHLEFKDLVNK